MKRLSRPLSRMVTIAALVGSAPIPVSSAAQAVVDREGTAVRLLDEDGRTVAEQEPDPSRTRYAPLLQQALTAAALVPGSEDVDGSGEIAPAVEIEPNAWPMYQADRRHTGYVPIFLEPEVFSLRWRRTVGPGTALNPVTAADGKVFVSLLVYFDEIPSFFALDARDGETLWSKEFGRVFSVNPPAYGYGNVYIQTGNHAGDTYLRAYDAATGEVVFEAPHLAQWERYFAPTIADGTVYVDGGSYGGMYGFDAFTGERLWFVDLPQYDEWTPAIDDTLAYAYLGEYSPGLYAVDRATGEIAFMIPDPNFDWNGWSMDLAPVLGAFDDAIAIHDGRLISFDLQGKSIRWELAADFVGQPSVAEGVIYALDDGGLVALREETGQELWSWRPSGGGLESNIIVTASHALVATAETVYAVELLGRADVWEYPAGGHLALGNDTLYVASATGMLTAISMPEHVPAVLTSLEISGPVHVVEGTSVQYTALAYYDDGRVRDRSFSSQWTVEPSDYASIDANGLLTATELLEPSQSMAVGAVYSEGGVTLRAERPVELVLSVTLSEFVERNILGAVEIQEEALAQLEGALLRERVARSALNELRNSGEADVRNALRLALALSRAINRTETGEDDIASSLAALARALEVLRLEAPQTLEGGAEARRR